MVVVVVVVVVIVVVAVVVVVVSTTVVVDSEFPPRSPKPSRPPLLGRSPRPKMPDLVVVSPAAVLVLVSAVVVVEEEAPASRASRRPKPQRSWARGPAKARGRRAASKRVRMVLMLNWKSRE